LKDRPVPDPFYEWVEIHSQQPWTADQMEAVRRGVREYLAADVAGPEDEADMEAQVTYMVSGALRNGEEARLHFDTRWKTTRAAWQFIDDTRDKIEELASRLYDALVKHCGSVGLIVTRDSRCQCPSPRTAE
jgi:hypothetical protein